MYAGNVYTRLTVNIGGLSTNLTTLRANLFLSATVAAVGIACPIALSFTLKSLSDATTLQAFAAGAALCSTSLGTTFTVLSTSGLTESRLGIALSSAAMMDDAVGLVMVEVISNLGHSSFDAITGIRPVLVSLALAILLPLACRWVVRPLTLKVWQPLEDSAESLRRFLGFRVGMLMVHTGVLLALVTGSTFAGTSNLFASYLAGAAVTWWSSLRDEQKNTRVPDSSPELKEMPSRRGETREPDRPVSTPSQDTTLICPVPTAASESENPNNEKTADQSVGPASVSAPQLSGLAIYEHYYASPVRYILKPFFFASIGFSIPVTQLFEGAIVWRGVIYAILMTIAKLLCGLCLISFPRTPAPYKSLQSMVLVILQSCWSLLGRQPREKKDKDSAAQANENQPAQAAKKP